MLLLLCDWGVILVVQQQRRQRPQGTTLPKQCHCRVKGKVKKLSGAARRQRVRETLGGDA